MFQQEPAKALHEALLTGNIKDRMTIKMDNELRYGELRFDHWLLHAKVVDLPTIIECLKTIDSKNFYKSADICQLVENIYRYVTSEMIAFVIYDLFHR